MYRPTLAIDSIGRDDPLSLDLSREHMQIVLDAMTAINLAYLRRGVRFPDLLESDVRYQLDVPAPGSACGDDDFQDIAITFRRKRGDCDDLAPIRAAQMQHRGLMVRAIALLRRSVTTAGRRHDYHIVDAWPPNLRSTAAKRLFAYRSDLGGHYPSTVYRDPSGSGLLLEDPSRLKGMR